MAPHLARLSRATLWLGAFAGLLGALGLLGNALHSELLYAIVPGRPRMRISTATFLVLTALRVLVRGARKPGRARRVSAQLIASAVLLFGILVIAEYVLDARLGIDWAPAGAHRQDPHPGRPSPLTAAAFVALGAAMLLVDVTAARAAVVREWLCITALFLSFVSLVGHVFGAGYVYELAGSDVGGVALPTSLALTALIVAELLAHPQRGLLRSLSSPGPGGVLLRRLGLTAVVATPLLGGLMLGVARAIGLVDLPLILALGNVVAVFVALLLLVATASSVERSHAAAEASRGRVREVVEQAPVGIFMADLQGRYTEVNAAGCQLLDFSREEILGKTILDFIPAEDAGRLWESQRRMLEGAVHVAEWRLRRRDGSYVPVEVTAKILSDGRWQGFVRDITAEQRHLAEQEFLARVGVELASSLEYRETLTRVVQLVVGFLGDIAAIDVLRDGVVRRVCVLHHDPHKRSVAQLVEQIGPARAVGHPLWTALETRQPVLLTRISDEDRRRFATSPEHARALEQVHATSAMLVPMIARGQLLAVLSISACNDSRSYGQADLRLAMDVARRAALALDNVQLYQQSRLEAAMTTNLAEGAVLIRASDATIVYANPRFEAMFGYGRGELVGQHVSVLNARPDQSAEQQAERIMEHLLRTGAWHGELKNVRKDSSEFWCAASVTTFSHAEYGSVWIAVHSDITERKQLEEKNAQALRDKEALFREIHHRVKNNLQVISSLFSLQRERTQSEELRGLLEESQTRVESIALVHEQLYRSADLAAIDLDEYLRALVQAIRVTYGAERVDIEVNAKDVVLDVEEAVPCALLVCELVSNSLKHAFTGGGKVWVRAQRDARGQCTLEVADDGAGMPADFDWRKARSLGLRLVQGFVRQLRGDVELDRSAGTRFIVRFPLRKRPAAAS